MENKNTAVEDNRKVMKAETARSLGKRKRNIPAITAGLIVLLLIAAVISVLIGRYSITPDMLWEILFHGDDPLSEEVEAASLVLFEARIARIAAAVLIGAALSAAGASYQGIFRNPMVSPDILGAATGASFGAALAILFGASALMIQVSAFCFGLGSGSGGVFREFGSDTAVRRSDSDAGSHRHGGISAVLRVYLYRQICRRPL